MKVKLRQEGKLVATLEVLDHGALVITMGGKTLELSVKDSRRVAGAIVENSITGTISKARSDIKRQARAHLDEMLGDDDGDD